MAHSDPEPNVSVAHVYAKGAAVVEHRAFALASAMSGLLAAYLMNRERLRVHDESGLIDSQLTGWFWLGFISTLLVAISGILMLLKRQRAP